MSDIIEFNFSIFANDNRKDLRREIQLRLKTFLALIIGMCLLFEPLTLISAAAPAENPEKEQFDPFMSTTLDSGPTAEVPWANDSKFISAKEQYKCPLLIAAYKTVLKDPLPGEEYNVHLAASYISGTVVQPKQIFSQNQKAGPYSLFRGYKEGPTYKGTKVFTTVGGGVCKVASTLYNVSVLSDLKIIERHSHGMPVPYVPYGQDATVYYGAKDFKFQNTTEHPILIWAKGVENVLYIGFYGQTIPPKVVWNHDVIKVYKAPVLYKTNPILPPDTEKVLHEGMDGAVISSWITLTYPDGFIKIKKMGRSYYSPLPYIIEKSGR
ncbi:MAG TPA: VanW family protein [Ruminiclostridium sp.]|nr:VanW family protein [Ruminiclostridium sp.]